MHRTNESKPDNMKDLGFRFSIQVDPHDPNRPLSILHMPPLSIKDLELTEKVIRSENLSMERLLVHSIYVRTRARLLDLKSDIQDRLLKGSDIEANLHGTPPVLSIPILQPCLRSELLLVTIDTHTGNLSTIFHSWNSIVTVKEGTVLPLIIPALSIFYLFSCGNY